MSNSELSFVVIIVSLAFAFASADIAGRKGYSVV